MWSNKNWVGLQVVGGKLAPLEVQLGLLQRCYTSLAIDEADEILYVATSSGDVATVPLPAKMLRPLCLSSHVLHFQTSQPLYSLSHLPVHSRS